MSESWLVLGAIDVTAVSQCLSRREHKIADRVVKDGCHARRVVDDGERGVAHEETCKRTVAGGAAFTIEARTDVWVCAGRRRDHDPPGAGYASCREIRLGVITAARSPRAILVMWLMLG
jgi:hypothetical protein